MEHEGRLLFVYGLFLSFVLYVFAFDESSALKFPPGDPRNCPPMSEGMNRFEVLPGGGWDNLRNLHAGEVTAVNYSQCKTTDDGKYLIPDNVFVYPLKGSKVETFAEMFDHWTNYSSTTTKSINAEASGNFIFGKVSGSFSSEYESVKKHQVEDSAVTTRVQLRHVLYTVRLQPDSALQPTFKSRLLDIAAHLMHNNTAYANFLAQILVRDFGTHVITSVDAGAVLAKVDHLTKKFVSTFQEDKSRITAAASASFFGAFGVSLSYSQTTDKKLLDQYTSNTVYSTVLTFGGPPFRGNFTINQWEDGLPDDLVSVDKSGDPLHYVITPGSLPEISEELTFKLANVVEMAIIQYYKHNTIKGCTKLDSPNFSFQANLDDGSCESPTNNYTFGGVYQTCQYEGSPVGDPCGPLLQKNPLTSSYSCSSEYEPVLVHEGSTPHRCQHDCGGCWLFFTCCHDSCGFARYSTYWCVAKGHVPPNMGYLFGGLYSSKLKNPVTNDVSCPLKFYPLHFGATVQVCVSDNYELGFQRSVPFAGFFSCKAGNPLAAKKTTSGASQGFKGSSDLESFVSQSGSSGWPKTCPSGYSQHLATIEEDCEINYCIKSNAFNSRGLPIIKRPPYIHPPKIYNYSVPLFLVNTNTGQIWFKRPTKNDWLLATKSSVKELSVEDIVNLNVAEDGLVPARHDDKQKTPQTSDDHSMRPGTAAGITFAVTILAGLVIALVVIGWRRHRSVVRKSSDLTLTESLNQPMGYGAVVE